MAIYFSGGISNQDLLRWVFPKIGVPQNGWFMMENPVKMDDLGKPIIFGNIQMSPEIFVGFKTNS